VTQHSKDPGARDSDERISLSDVDELDAEEIQAVGSPSSTPPPPPKEALQHVVVPRLAPLSSDSLAPPRVPASDPPPDPEVTATRSERRVRARREEDEADDRDVVDIRWVLAAAVLLAVVIGTWTLARRGEPRVAASANTDRVTVTLSGVPSGARVELDGRPVTERELTVRSGVRHAVEVHAEGRETWRQVFITRGQLELVVQLEAAQPAATVATVPVGELPPEVDTPEEPLAEDPPANEPVVAERPAPPPTTPREPRSTTTATTMSTSTTPSTPHTSTTTSTMRSTHTLVRDPGF
jgi:hypothetical protein